MAQEVEHVPSKCQALISNPSAAARGGGKIGLDPKLLHSYIK
jgi:hypothetical protein